LKLSRTTAGLLKYLHTWIKVSLFQQAPLVVR
jgi:hypothetical protein